jgi:hypothetical protein
MKVTLESTTKTIDLHTPTGVVPARIWEGRTDTGIEVHAFITRICVSKDADHSAFERELEACRPVRRLIEATYDRHMVL